jgi:hypothetical protein
MSPEAKVQAEARLRELGIDPGETYDGPNPDNVTQFPTEAAPTPLQIAPVINRAQYVETLAVALNVLSARFLGVVAVIGAVAMFGWAVYDPLPWRLAAVGTYAAVVLWPIVWLYLRRG